MNKCFLLGRLGRDPELKSARGMSILEFSIATTEKVKSEEKTEWHNIIAFGTTAENCGKFLKKGSRVLVEGKIQNKSWNDVNGVKKYRTEILAAKIDFLDAKKPEEQISNEVPEDFKRPDDDVLFPF